MSAETQRGASDGQAKIIPSLGAWYTGPQRPSQRRNQDSRARWPRHEVHVVSTVLRPSPDCIPGIFDSRRDVCGDSISFLVGAEVYTGLCQKCMPEKNKLKGKKEKKKNQNQN